MMCHQLYVFILDFLSLISAPLCSTLLLLHIRLLFANKNFLLTYLLTYLITYLLTYLLTTEQFSESLQLLQWLCKFIEHTRDETSTWAWSSAWSWTLVSACCCSRISRLSTSCFLHNDNAIRHTVHWNEPASSLTDHLDSACGMLA